MNASTLPALTPVVPPTDVALAPVALKIVLLLLTGISTHYSLTPPRTAAPKTILPNKTLFERGVLWVTWCSKVREPARRPADEKATRCAETIFAYFRRWYG